MEEQPVGLTWVFFKTIHRLIEIVGKEQHQLVQGDVATFMTFS